MVTVMIVDDAAFLRTYLKSVLEEAGHEVIAEAENGWEAIEKYKNYRPELVTMDVHMPALDGMETLNQILKIDPQANIIMCSATGQKHYIIDAVHRGAKDYILKPFQPTRLIDSVNRVVRTAVDAHA